MGNSFTKTTVHAVTQRLDIYTKKDSSEPGKADGAEILYVEMDGTMFDTRKQENNSTWQENKLGVVFSSRDLRTYQMKDGKQAKRIGKREYISYAGPAEIFLEFLYSTTLKNGFESHGKVVIVSNGAR